MFKEYEFFITYWHIRKNVRYFRIKHLCPHYLDYVHFVPKFIVKLIKKIFNMNDAINECEHKE